MYEGMELGGKPIAFNSHERWVLVNAINHYIELCEKNKNTGAAYQLPYLKMAKYKIEESAQIRHDRRGDFENLN